MYVTLNLNAYIYVKNCNQGLENAALGRWGRSFS